MKLDRFANKTVHITTVDGVSQLVSLPSKAIEPGIWVYRSSKYQEDVYLDENHVILVSVSR